MHPARGLSALIDPAPHALTEPELPPARGPVTAFLLEHLRLPPHTLPRGPVIEDDPLGGDDLHLALYVCYELHYRSFAGVDEAWEWEPTMLELRGELESLFELALLAELGASDGADVEAALQAVIAAGAAGPSLSGHMEEHGQRWQFEEFAIHRSAYQLKEADPHTWCIPRLSGGPKAALVEIQSDEYGRGVEADMHAVLFATTMASLGLDTQYGAYLPRIPGVTLATVNLASLFGLHRRLRGALVGHLATFEMTSTGPMARYSRALERLGVDARGRRFYDVHVEADVHHAVVAAQDMAAGLAAVEPTLADDIVFGARALMLTEARFAAHVLSCWDNGVSSLLAEPVPLGR